MVRWELVASAPVSDGGGEMRLYRRGEELSIRVDGNELMSSRAHGSEEALAQRAMARIAGLPRPRVLVGGLGLGYTLAAVLRGLPLAGAVVLAELVPAVVEWNRGVAGPLAGHPLRDGRVEVRVGDVVTVLRSGPGAFDAVVLDVDNGPAGLTQLSNEWLYGPEGLAAARDALRPGGVLAVWSASPEDPFTARLQRVGFQVDEQRVRARAPGKGAWHTLWIATRSR